VELRTSRDPYQTEARRPPGRPVDGRGPRPSVLSLAIRRYWALIFLIGIIGAAAGVGAAILREPTYTSESELNVGQADLATLSLPGYAQGAQALAGSYARIVETEPVVDEIARRLRISPGDVQTRLSTEPLPDSSIFRIEGEGATGSDAERFTEVSTDVATEYIEGLQAQGARASRSALREYRDLARKVQRLEERAGRLAGRRRGDPGLVTAREVSEARADVESARLEQEALAARYQNADLQDPRFQKGITLISSPSPSASDRNSWAQKLGFAGMSAGLLVGLALAILLVRRRIERGTLA
jgi:uncharacterized protein involved in exopolysaccharide biosynthesis